MSCFENLKSYEAFVFRDRIKVETEGKELRVYYHNDGHCTSYCNVVMTAEWLGN